MRGSVLVCLVVATVLSISCRPGSGEDPRARVPVPAEGAARDPVDAEFPHLRFADGSRTPNDRCMILQRKLNPAIPPIYVNGTPLGFC